MVLKLLGKAVKAIKETMLSVCKSHIHHKKQKERPEKGGVWKNCR